MTGSAPALTVWKTIVLLLNTTSARSHGESNPDYRMDNPMSLPLDDGTNVSPTVHHSAVISNCSLSLVCKRDTILGMAGVATHCG